MNNDNNNNIVYDKSLETLLAKLGERAEAYSILYQNMEDRFTKLNTRLSLPVIVLSGIVGSASIGSASLFGGSEIAPVGIGLVSIFVGVLQTINSYFAYGKMAENARLCSISYKKLNREVVLQLSLPRNSRMGAKYLLKYIKTEYERLLEIQNVIPKDIVEDFNNKYKGSKTELPSECNGLHPIVINDIVEKDKTFGDIIKSFDSFVNKSVDSLSPISADKISLDIQPLNSLRVENEKL